MNCLPFGWVTSVPGDVMVVKNEEKAFFLLYQASRAIKSVVGFFIDAVCLAKKYVITLIKPIVSIIDREFFLQNKYRRVFRNKKGFIDWVTSARGTAKMGIVEVYIQVKSALGKAWDKVTQPVKDMIENAKQQFFELKESLINWFQSQKVISIMSSVRCILCAVNYSEGVIGVIIGFFDKFKNIIKAYSVGIISTAGVFADIILGLISNWKDFVNGVAAFDKGFAAQRSGERWYYYGLATGYFAAGIGSAPTIQEEFQNQ